jgi:ADP-ribosylation factor GTPase-activating protein 1
VAVKIAEGDFAKQAQLTAAQLARQAQQAGKNAQEGFNRFVEGGDNQRNAPLDESRKGFWDDFSSLADQQQQQQQQRKPANSAIGTGTMGMSKRGGPAAASQKKGDDWDDW